jgi:hypothetical protein
VREGDAIQAPNQGPTHISQLKSAKSVDNKLMSQILQTKGKSTKRSKHTIVINNDLVNINFIVLAAVTLRFAVD